MLKRRTEEADMEEAHRIHKDAAWGWFVVIPPVAAAVRRAVVAALPPRGHVVTPWSVRASRDWTA